MTLISKNAEIKAISVGMHPIELAEELDNQNDERVISVERGNIYFANECDEEYADLEYVAEVDFIKDVYEPVTDLLQENGYEMVYDYHKEAFLIAKHV